MKVEYVDGTAFSVLPELNRDAPDILELNRDGN
jgi:hypothetical protein